MKKHVVGACVSLISIAVFAYAMSYREISGFELSVCMVTSISFGYAIGLLYLDESMKNRYLNYEIIFDFLLHEIVKAALYMINSGLSFYLLWGIYGNVMSLERSPKIVHLMLLVIIIPVTAWLHIKIANKEVNN